ncbi:unnamed protein product [Cladocopium goreaui]|uniref:Smr domain-containing protein n=1 Tax=Cladocopium goreaui TaxID=2562237 RepID=A0A9P1BR50_9DINO|nr:unnamed protein product [Cladocopium goreaui]
MSILGVDDIVAWNGAMQSYSKARQWQSVLHLLYEAPKYDLQLTLVTYVIAISSCYAWPLALAVLEEFRRSRLQQDIQDINAYNAAISACNKGEEWQRALQLLSNLPQAQLLPDVVTFNTASSACGKVSEWQRSLTLLQQMQDLQLEATVISFGAALSAAEKGQQWPLALQLLSEMKDGLVAGNVIVFSAAISACEKGSQWLQAMQLLEDLKEGCGGQCLRQQWAVAACAGTAVRDAARWNSRQHHYLQQRPERPRESGAMAVGHEVAVRGLKGRVAAVRCD